MADPNGRVDRLARAYTSLAIGALVDVLRAPLAKDADKIRAAAELLDRGHGKATQATITVSAKGAAAHRLAMMSTDALLERIEASGGMDELRRRHAIEGQFTEMPRGLPAPEPATPTNLTAALPEDGSDLI